MSNWPPPPSYNTAPQPPAPSSRAGCGRALLITALLTGVSLALVAFIAKSDRGFMPVLEKSIGVIRIEGPITDSRDAVEVIRKFRESKMISAIVMRLETPGGGVGASEEIYREVLKARLENKKPVIVSMGSVAASGGYYIAAASQHIFATSGTITGSIGVISPMFNVRETLDKLGIKQSSLTTGEHKDTGSPFDEQTTGERALLQGVINDMYRQFFQVVLQARHEAITKAESAGNIDPVINAAETKIAGKNVEWTTFTTGTIAAALGVPVEAETALRKLADGRVYTGEQGLQVGLVDSIGTLQDAIDFAGREADLGDDPPTIDRTPGADASTWFGAAVRSFIQEATAPTQAIQLRSQF